MRRPLRFALTLLLTGVTLAWAPAQVSEEPKVVAVRFWSLGDVTRVAIETTGEFKFRSDRLQNPDRVFFDLMGAKPQFSRKGMNVTQVGDKLLKQIRVAETQRGVTRVVLDLEAPAEVAASQLSNPDRLIIELHALSAPVPKTPQYTAAAELDPPPSIAISTPSAAAPVPGVNAKIEASPRASRSSAALNSLSRPGAPVESVPLLSTPPVLPAQTALPAKRGSASSQSMTRVLGLKIGRIVLDPGHGGHDVGTQGPTGLYEKDLVLDVAKRLAVLIQDRLGSEVVFTRSDDTFIPLEERTAIANQNKADLFLSIHANSSPVRSVSGVETYYLNFTTSKEALELAGRENAGAQSSVYDLREMLQKIALKEKVEESREFASRIQTSMCSLAARGNSHQRDRGVRRAPFVVLIGATMPSVLAEIGFISNDRDEGLMKRPEHREKLAEALFKGLAQYAGTLSHFQVAQRAP